MSEIGAFKGISGAELWPYLFLSNTCIKYKINMYILKNIKCHYIFASFQM